MQEDKSLFLIFIRPLNRLEADYMVTGSTASMAYGVPRVTLDIDLVVELSAAQIRLLPLAFPQDEFYCPPREVIDIEIERRARGHFNIIHTKSGFKADCYPVGGDALHKWAMMRRRNVEMLGERVPLAPPEYVILRKLEYFKEGGSEKHLIDIRGMLDVSRDIIHMSELDAMINERDLDRQWQRVHELRF